MSVHPERIQCLTGGNTVWKGWTKPRVHLKLPYIFNCTRSVDGSGHTWNIYFSKWDGKKLVEYGGLEITEDQLKKAKNRSRIFY